MKKKRFLIAFAFSGEKFQGVAHIPNDEYSRTVQKVFELKISLFFQSKDFKTRFSSRLDKGVSALKTYCMLIFNQAVECRDVELSLQNIADDIFIYAIKALDDRAIMLDLVLQKKYTYFFSFGESSDKQLPWVHYKDEFDINLINQNLIKLKGEHDFINFIAKKSKAQISRIESTKKYIDSVDLKWEEYPEILLHMQNRNGPLNTWGLSFSACSFMRGQVRLMVGALFKLGTNQITVDRFDQLLSTYVSDESKWRVPGKGLILMDTQLKN